MAPTLTGVTQGQIGEQYTFALGYSSDGATALMVGYVQKEGSEWEESTDIQDSDRLVQIASPNSTDRFTFYPKVSQGDWSGGERQVFYVEPTRFYQTNGLIETSQPGRLQLAPSLTFSPQQTTSGTTTAPVDTDGTFVYFGVLTTAGANNMARFDPSAGTFTLFNIGGGGQVYDVHVIPYDGYQGPGAGHGGNLMVGSQNGIFAVSGTTQTDQMCNDKIQNVDQMAFWAGALYYVTDTATLPDYLSQVLKSVVAPVGAGVGTTVWTIPKMWLGITRIVGTNQGVLMALHGTTKDALYLYTGSGTPSLVSEIQGQVMSMCHANGVTYILVLPRQLSSTTNFQLLSFEGSALTSYDDLRLSPVEFQSTGVTFLGVASGGGPTPGVQLRMSTDGIYLYMAWPGQRVFRYTLSTGAMTELGGVHANVTNVSSRGALMTTSGLVEWNQTGGGGPFWFVYGGSSYTAAGQITTSFIDFDTPATAKLYRSVEIELSNALPSGGSVVAAYRFDSVSAYTTLTTIALDGTHLVAYFPAGTKGPRIQLRLTLTPGSNLSPVVLQMSLNARLGHVWKTTVQCYRGQRLLNSQDDTQGVDSSGALANLLNAYRNAAGRCILFVPAPDQPGGTEQVNATIEQLNWRSKRPGPYQTDQSALATEGEVELVLVEDL